MSFEQQIKDWVVLDNEIKEKNEELKYMRSQRNEITTEIYTHVKKNDLQNAVVQISNGKLRFQNVKVTPPLTLKFIQECLTECIDNEDDVSTIMKHIKSRREPKYVEEIKRYYNKEE
jgi:hypothetical protein